MLHFSNTEGHWVTSNFESCQDDGCTPAGTPLENLRITPVKRRSAITSDLICNRPNTLWNFNGIRFQPGTLDPKVETLPPGHHGL
ncbi:hypothetical protein AVEN_244003-1 [Araneus ventricosus]|uniref:Uncharacterized protein n=1 Tax=Araneus ventricosus TaxID=182803 RepID=A0A4Y2I3Q5_ARAVE|nr:hypothetical protein AVEN_244003-1 [Araneus ventricosus]